MREFKRPLITCVRCKAQLFNWRNRPHGRVANAVEVNWEEPPRKIEKCPRCSSDVDTSSAYPSINGFPANFEQLRVAYDGFSPTWEYNRRSFELEMQASLDEGATLESLEAELNTREGFEWYRQRMFYRSTTGFYRSLQLFLAFLSLERHAYRSWGQVTAYYSRFYFIQAFINLLLSTFLNNGKEKALIFFSGEKVVCHDQQRQLPKLMQRMTSHDIWWALMEALKTPDYPCENLSFILSRLIFNPENRQRVNYSYEYMSGFNELEWFDSGPKQLLSHFMPRHRPDRDVTNIDRFFRGYSYEEADPADFYTDDAGILWCCLIGYMQLLKSLRIKQDFVRTETIIALCELHIGKEYPQLLLGIARSVSESLNDGFDLAKFEEHYNSSEEPGPFFKYW
jgi:hypothetical protein